MILGIDTSAGQCAAALVSGDTVIARRAERMDRGHAERLFDLVEAALADAGLGLETIARIAVCTGPGSFTGLRVGVAGARGLALGRAVPALGITRFEALATAVARPGWPGTAAEGEAAREGGAEPRRLEDKVGWQESRPLAVALAGRGAVFLQSFAPDLAPLGPPALIAPEALTLAMPARAVRVGDGWAVAGAEADLLPEGLADPAILAALAATRAPGPLPAPLYLRDADADPPREAPPVLLD